MDLFKESFQAYCEDCGDRAECDSYESPECALEFLIQHITDSFTIGELRHCSFAVTENINVFHAALCMYMAIQHTASIEQLLAARLFVHLSASTVTGTWASELARYISDELTNTPMTLSEIYFDFEATRDEIKRLEGLD